MTDGIERDEDELQHRQGAQLYPVGRSLRSTFPALDGDELQPRITSLMVELSHQPYERDAQPRSMQPGEAPAPSVLRHLGRLFRRDAS